MEEDDNDDDGLTRTAWNMNFRMTGGYGKAFKIYCVNCGMLNIIEMAKSDEIVCTFAWVYLLFITEETAPEFRQIYEVL